MEVVRLDPERLEEASTVLARGDRRIGPEHILLGLVTAAGAPESGLAADADRVREGLALILSGPTDQLPDPGPQATRRPGFLGSSFFADSP